jgi:prepilin-type N-terminal cleavage/methylation domain-containing protein
MKPASRPNSGFSLIEMAIVLMIVALLLGSGLGVLSAQIEQQKFKDTQRTLDEAKEALLGFAAANGRLPCPASAASNGIESPAGGGVCTNPYDGFLPAVTLGLPGVDANGYLIDGWQVATNRVRYAVTTVSTNAATTLNGIRTATMATFGPLTDLHVCGTSTGITATTCGTATALTANAVAVIFSLGPNAKNGVAGGADETANQNGDRVFVSHTPVDVGGTNGEFDDMFTWIPPSILFNRMLQAGSLP